MVALRLARVVFESEELVEDLAGRMKSSLRSAERRAYKVIEGLTLAGDSRGVVDAFQSINIGEVSEGDRALIDHYVAVAYANLGDNDRAARFWRDALRYDPEMEAAVANLDDLRKPVEQQHGSEAFSVNQLIPAVVLDELVKAAKSLKFKDGSRERSKSGYLKHALDTWPLLGTAQPAILDLCDGDMASLFVGFLEVIDDQRILDYADKLTLGHRGSDELRMRIQTLLSEREYPLGDKITMWLRGQECEVLLMGYKIDYEAMTLLPPEGGAIAAPACEHLASGRYKKAEIMFRDAVARFPDYPSLWNNLAAAVEKQRRSDEGMQIIERMFQKFPDYLFARTAIAMRRVRQSRIEEAKRVLEPIKLQGHLHIAEFRALAAARLEICSSDPAATPDEM